MPCVHEFRILDGLDKWKDYIDYEPHKYNCISVDDDIMNSVNKHLSIMKTYFHSFNRPEFGLSYFGITIIPPESLSLFYEIVTSSGHFKESVELNILASKILQATEQNKFMIHFGI
ncbi:short-chain dehydrogenase [Psychrobacillus sp. INOP01]|uniref:short-chain dehydrogenase n=1 Tax=Psychrobacillus sp. INOP01 TaxID=2829187 RepID=UPI001BA57307|nr:short-chain dehydrogenase [Psychrobacillus sp. INOP01]QUG41774.1 short-chain dehydrogenase [Psychrobacillus sp. INOP01]